MTILTISEIAEKNGITPPSNIELLSSDQMADVTEQAYKENVKMLFQLYVASIDNFADKYPILFNIDIDKFSSDKLKRWYALMYVFMEYNDKSMICSALEYWFSKNGLLTKVGI